MSGLVEKVKDVVRNRSKHRQTSSTNSAGASNSGDQYVLAPKDSQDRKSMQESRQGRASGEQNGVGDATTNLAAMKLEDQGSTVRTNHPPLPANAAHDIENARAHKGVPNGNYQQRRPLSDDMTTPRTPTHRRDVSGSIGDLDAPKVSPEIVPDRNSSMKRKPLPSTKVDTGPNGLSNSLKEDAAHPKGPRTPPRHRHTRSRDVASDDPSPLVPQFTTRSAASPISPDSSNSSGSVGEPQRRDLRLPANFDLTNTERTQVDTTIRPAVTAETVHIQRTEIITKAVHKDIHIDHYYTYLQPIPIREVLPARHFQLDPTTGIKTEIPAPVGYKLPAHLEPRKPEDYSHLKRTTRHYVVDNDHPHGQLENPPLRHKEDTSNLQEELDAHQNGPRD